MARAALRTAVEAVVRQSRHAQRMNILVDPQAVADVLEHALDLDGDIVDLELQPDGSYAVPTHFPSEEKPCL